MVNTHPHHFYVEDFLRYITRSVSRDKLDIDKHFIHGCACAPSYLLAKAKEATIPYL